MKIHRYEVMFAMSRTVGWVSQWNEMAPRLLEAPVFKCDPRFLRVSYVSGGHDSCMWGPKSDGGLRRRQDELLNGLRMHPKSNVSR